MPIFLYKTILPAGEIGIWKIEEEEPFFKSQLDLDDEETTYINQIKGHRRVEWLASRLLLHKMSGRKHRGRCYKDSFGKPHLEASDFQISISHSSNMAAIIAAPRLVGIDIQKEVAKIERIAHKFMRPIEADSLIPDSRISHLHIYWGAKEALYKAYGRRSLDFKAHIHIVPFKYNTSGNGQFRGSIIKADYRADFELFYERYEDYHLVYALEITEELV